jgi:hypothetical protein
MSNPRSQYSLISTASTIRLGLVAILPRRRSTTRITSKASAGPLSEPVDHRSSHRRLAETR